MKLSLLAATIVLATCARTHPRACPAPTPCRSWTFSESAGECVPVDARAGSTCDDGNATSREDTCDLFGECVGKLADSTASLL